MRRTCSQQPGGWGGSDWLAIVGSSTMTAEITEIRGSISPQGPHQPEAGRYVLYTALGCPFVAMWFGALHKGE